MRLIRLAFWSLLGACLVVVGLANMSLVEMTLLPQSLAELAQIQLSSTMPLSVIIYASVVAGLLIGFLWEWLRGHPQRAALARAQHELDRLQIELSIVKAQKAEDEGKDEILALLEDKNAVNY